MTDRRIIPYYRPRIQIPVSTMSDAPGQWALFCLPIDGAQALARICGYLNREVTYIGEVVDNQVFAGPTQAELETIRDIVGETELALMAGCDFSTLEATLAAISTTLDAMMVCICQATEYQGDIANRLPDLSEYVLEGLVTYKPTEQAMVPFTPPVGGSEECELAQAMFYYTYQMFTEQILPFATSTADALTTAIIATATFVGVASWVGLPVALLAGIFAAAVNWAIDGSITNFVNWLLGNKDELICEIYNNLPDAAAAAAAARAYVNAAGDLPATDKFLLNQVIGSAWHMSVVFADQQQNGTWDAYLVPGQCDDCEPPDPECVTLDCDLGNWSQIPPAVLACEGGSPYITSAQPARWIATAPIQQANDFRLEVDWTAKGDSGSATMRVDLWSKDTNTHITVGPDAVQPVGSRTISIWDLASGASVGEELQLASAQMGWYAVIHSYCIKPIP